jgi:hypothetical protein
MDGQEKDISWSVIKSMAKIQASCIQKEWVKRNSSGM